MRAQEESSRQSRPSARRACFAPRPEPRTFAPFAKSPFADDSAHRISRTTGERSAPIIAERRGRRGREPSANFRRLWIGESAATSSASAYLGPVCEPYCRRWRTAAAVAGRRARQALSLERYVEETEARGTARPPGNIWRTAAARKGAFLAGGPRRGTAGVENGGTSGIGIMRFPKIYKIHIK